MKFQVVTVFPELIEGALRHGVVGQAVLDGRVQLSVANLRQWASGVHQAVDDRPFGGGDGMVMSAEIAGRALEALGFARVASDRREEGAPGSTPGPLVYPSARGRPMTDALARAWAKEPQITFFCGRYGGLDQRAIEAYGMQEIALGDYVLSGGEIAVLAMIDATARHLPGVLGNRESPENESFSRGLLEEPQFTRPREWNGLAAPVDLLSGNHARIARWRSELSLLCTADVRPDLLDGWAERAGERAARDAAAAALRRLASLSPDDVKACGLKRPAEIERVLRALVVEGGAK